MNICFKNNINFITMFCNKTPQITVNVDYTVLEQVCTVWKHDGNKNNLRTIKTQIVQKLKNNEPRPNFTGSHIKKSVYVNHLESFTSSHISPNSSLLRFRAFQQL